MTASVKFLLAFLAVAAAQSLVVSGNVLSWSDAYLTNAAVCVPPQVTVTSTGLTVKSGVAPCKISSPEGATNWCMAKTEYCKANFQLGSVSFKQIHSNRLTSKGASAWKLLKSYFSLSGWKWAAKANATHTIVTSACGCYGTDLSTATNFGVVPKGLVDTAVECYTVSVRREDSNSSAVDFVGVFGDFIEKSASKTTFMGDFHAYQQFIREEEQPGKLGSFSVNAKPGKAVCVQPTLPQGADLHDEENISEVDGVPTVIATGINKLTCVYELFEGAEFPTVTASVLKSSNCDSILANANSFNVAGGRALASVVSFSPIIAIVVRCTCDVVDPPQSIKAVCNALNPDFEFQE